MCDNGAGREITMGFRATCLIAEVLIAQWEPTSVALLVFAVWLVVVLALATWVAPQGRAARALWDSENGFRRLMDDWPELIVRYDRDGRRLYVNRAVERAYGVPREQLIGRSFAGHDDDPGRLRFDPESAAALQERIREVFEHGRRVEAEVTLRTVDGERKGHAVLIAERDRSGRVTNVLAVGRDLTDCLQAEQEVAERGSRFRDVFENVLDGICLLEVSPDGQQFRVLEQNPALERSTGIPRSATIGKLFEDALPPAASAMLIPWFRRCVETAVPIEGEAPLDLPSGRRWFRSACIPARDEDGRVYRLVAIVQDITDRWEAERALADSEERFRLAFDDSLVGMALLRVGSDPHFRHLRVNRAMCEFLDRCEEELLGAGQTDVLCPEDAEVTQEAFEELLSGHRTCYRDEHRFRRAGGGIVWGLLSATLVRDADGAPLYVLSQIEDITSRKCAEEQLMHRALHDDLTGLPNRALLLEHLGNALARSRRTGSSVGVLFVDLDDFKSINDSLGHAAGDELLCRVAAAIRASVRASDIAARVGGDEFVVVCEDLNDPADAAVVATQIQRVFASRILLRGQPVTTGASIGIALSHEGSTPEDLLHDADSAVYSAKNQGGRRWEPADPRLHPDLPADLPLDACPSLQLTSTSARVPTVETELRRAVRRQELLVHYQPLIDLRTGLITSVEALLRWQHPERGLVLPRDFIEVAERNGLIVEIGAWVLDTACAQAVNWYRRYGPAAPDLAVNASSRQLGTPGTAPRIKDVLDDGCLPADRVCLEITESQLATVDMSSAWELHTLAEHGVRIAVDDFGTGAGAVGFDYLRRLPVHEFKIDRSLVTRLGARPIDTAVVAGLVALGRNLGLTVVAEGIETPTQLQALRDLGCTWGQGWLWHPALPPEDIDTLLAARAPGAGAGSRS
jgi:diguanylate cyclase (GGDEF)-like protein/PAS domain S-box-containing protein